jgi:hypothetical protein
LTHERSEGDEQALWNYAHDYIINDMLAHDLDSSPPQEALVWEGARFHPAEVIVEMLRRGELSLPDSRTALPGPPPSRTMLSRALEEAGIIKPSEPRPQRESDVISNPCSGDVLSEKQERVWFPDDPPARREQARQKVREVAVRSVSLRAIQDLHEPDAGRGDDTGGYETVVETLRLAYRPPWELALQRWLEAVAPGPRSYARPSRRGADRTDVVLPGRTREGWTLHIVLDTSGSMAGELPRALGMIASFCDGVAVETIHLLQCDAAVTRDERVTPVELRSYTVAGLGGSDMTPALLALAEDPEVEAVIVLTDGYIAYPEGPMPYEVLWVLTEHHASFDPDYGQVLLMPHRGPS